MAALPSTLHNWACCNDHMEVRSSTSLFAHISVCILSDGASSSHTSGTHLRSALVAWLLRTASVECASTSKSILCVCRVSPYRKLYTCLASACACGYRTIEISLVSTCSWQSVAMVAWDTSDSNESVRSHLPYPTRPRLSQRIELLCFPILSSLR